MATSVKQRPHVSVSSASLADWLANQPECWWFVDGDPVLTGRMDFPCPSSELEQAVRRLGKKLLIVDQRDSTNASGESIAGADLDRIADRENIRGERTFLCCWDDADVDWLLVEDKTAVDIGA